MGSTPQVSVLVAHRDVGDGWRDRLWAFVRQTLPPEWEVCVGTNDERPFNKARATNEAALKASGDVFLITDTDTLVPDLTEALELVQRGRWVRPYTVKVKLTEQDTERVMAGEWEYDPRAPVERITPFRWAPPYLVSREMYEMVGGFDPRFSGWGSEDIAFGHSLKVLCGPGINLPGRVFHLWHPRIGESGKDLWDGQESREPNHALARRYAFARRPEAMRDLLAERQEVG